MGNMHRKDGIQVAARPLLEWYLKNRRDLPWRQTTNPYKIWISEIMLQQTRVDTVIQYYRRFLERFDTLQDLAEAPVQEVLTLWKGLGYYSRAMNLQKAAQQVMVKHGGIFPQDYEAIRKLPGIGDYTAGAIASIAFNQPFPAVDGNVLRVISRLEGIQNDIMQDKTRKQIAAIVQPSIPEGHAGDFTQSLMELGALICTPLEPHCAQCPVQCYCTALHTGQQNELPIKKKKEPPRKVPCWVAVLQEDGKILLEYRKNDGLLGQMWGLPLVEKKHGFLPEQQFKDKYGLGLKKIKKLGTASHTFSHQVWQVEVYLFKRTEELPNNEVLHWVAETQLERYAIPTAFQRVLNMINSKESWEQLELLTE